MAKNEAEDSLKIDCMSRAYGERSYCQCLTDGDNSLLL
jgi:hypothetical protein